VSGRVMVSILLLPLPDCRPRLWLFPMRRKILPGCRTIPFGVRRGLPVWAVSFLCGIVAIGEIFKFFKGSSFTSDYV
jgi:hypothetical protein